MVLDVARFEREMQLQQFDAVDGKAGTIMGFAGVIVGLVASVEYPDVLLFLPAMLAGAITVLSCLRVLRSRKVLRQSPEDAYAWWANDPLRHAQWQAYSDELRTLRTNDGIVEAKVEHLKAAWTRLAWSVALTVLGIVTRSVLGLIGVQVG